MFRNRLTLQRGVDAVEVRAPQQELVAAHIPGHVAGVGHDLFVRRRGNEAALGFLKITLVLERQRGAQALLQLDRELRWHPSLRMEMFLFLHISSFVCAI